MSSSRIVYSLDVKPIGMPARVTQRFAGSSVKSVTRRTAGLAQRDRRSSALIRATSSAKANGLVRKSSAPVLRPLTRSATLGRAPIIKDRRSRIARPKRPTDGDAVVAGHEPVEQDEVVLVHEGLLIFGVACGGEIDREAFFLQTSSEVLCSLGIVLDQENAHARSAATSILAVPDRTPRRPPRSVRFRGRLNLAQQHTPIL